MGETDTRQPPYASSACQSVEPVSRKRTCKVGPGRFIPQYRRIKIRLVTASKLSNQRPQQLCSTRAWNLRINLAHDATVGDRSRIQKISYASPRSIYGEYQQRERGECIFIPLKIAKRKRYKNAVGGVVLAAIQIAVDSDLSTEQRRLRVQHTCSPVTSPTP